MRFRVLVLLLVAFGMFVIGMSDLLSLSVGTCGANAGRFWHNCWEMRLIRSLTGWPTNVAAAIADFAFALLALVMGLAMARGGFDNEPIEAPPPAPRYRHAWWLVPLAVGIVGALMLRLNGMGYLGAFALGVLFSAATIRIFGRYL